MTIVAELAPQSGTGLGGRYGSCDNVAVAADKPRILQNNRDMALSMIPLVIICLLVAGLAGQCSFSPGGPTEGEIPDYDAEAALKGAAHTYAMPVRLPEAPQGWTANSGGIDRIDGGDGGKAVRVGYITDGGDYIALSQSNARPHALANFLAGEERVAGGHENVDGVDWTVYAQEGAEPVWVADRGDARWGMTGRPGDGDFRTLAEAVAEARLLPAD